MTIMGELVVSWEMKGDRPVRAVLEFGDGEAIGIEVPQWPPEDWPQDQPQALAQIVDQLRQDHPASVDERLAEILHQRGPGLWSNLFPGRIGETILQRMHDRGRHRLVLQTDNDYLLCLPLEAARPPGNDPPIGLDDRLEPVRRVSGPRLQTHAPPAPLRIVTAVESPENGRADAAMLDRDAQEKLLLDALESPIARGAASVEFLDEGQLSMVAAAVERLQPQVLHLAGHAAGGEMLFETPDGGMEQVAPARLAQALGERDAVRLIIAAACVTGAASTSEEPIIQPRIAKALIAEGLPAVMALHTAVTDEFAARLLDSLYTALAEGETPSAAVARARREVGSSQGSKPAVGQWAIPVLFQAAQAVQLFDPDTQQLPRRREISVDWPGVSYKAPGEFIGRSDEIRRTLDLLRHPDGVAYIWHGVSGIGTSTLCTQIAERLRREDGYLPVVLRSRIMAADILICVYERLREHAHQNAHTSSAEAMRELAEPLSPTSSLEEQARWQWLTERVLNDLPMLFICDAFEGNLRAPGPAEEEQERYIPQDDQPFCMLLDDELDERLRYLLSANTQARFLFASRFPCQFTETQMLFGVEQDMLGPLSANAARKLMFALPHLWDLSPQEKERVDFLSGRLPQVLELVDGVLIDAPQAVKDELLFPPEQALVALEQDGWDVSEPDDRVREFVGTATQDMITRVLCDWIEGTNSGEFLGNALVYLRPVPREGLDAVVDRPVKDDEIDFLSERSVLVQRGELYMVPRSVGDTIYSLTHSEANRQAHLRAASYWRERVETSQMPHFGLRTDIWLHLMSAKQFPDAWEAMFDLHGQLGEYGYYESAKSLARSVYESAAGMGFPGVQAEAAHILAEYAHSESNFDQAERLYSDSREHARAADAAAYEGRALAGIGKVHSDRGELQEAVDYYKRALKILRRRGWPPYEASTLTALGRACLRLGQESQAIDHCTKALQLQRQLGDKSGEGQALSALGNAYSSLGKPQEAAEYYEQSIQVLREAEASVPVVQNLGNLATTYNELELPSQAADCYQQGLKLAKEIDYREDDVRQLFGLAEAHHRLERWEEAGECCERVLEVVGKVGDPHSQARALMGLGKAQYHAGETALAADTYRDAMKAAEKTNDTPLIGTITASLALAYRQMHRPYRAIGYYERALELFRQAPDRSPQALMLESLGELYLEIGEPGEAIGCYQRALSIHDEIGEDENIHHALLALGISHGSAGELQQAKELFRQAAELARQTGNWPQQRAALTKLTVELAEMEQFAQARQFVREALNLALQQTDAEQAAWNAGLLGELCRELDELQAAVALGAFAFARFRQLETGDLNQISSDLYECREEMGDEAFAEALEHAEETVADIFTDIAGEQAADMARPLSVSHEDISAPTLRPNTILRNLTGPQLEQLVSGADESSDWKRSYSLWSSIGVEYLRRDNFERAASLARKAIHNARHRGADEDIAHMAFLLATALAEQGMVDEAREIAQEGLQAARNADHDRIEQSLEQMLSQLADM